MKKRMRKKIPKLRSKKGMTLVEILAGVVIIVIVFGSTLSAMTNGFSSTLRNATTNKYAVESESVNEIILQAISKYNFQDEDDARDVLEADVNAIEMAAQSVVPEMKYVDSSEYDSKDYDNKFTVVFLEEETKSTVTTSLGGRKKSDYVIRGMQIKTAVTTSTGVVRNVSFVPYSEQLGK